MGFLLTRSSIAAAAAPAIGNSGMVVQVVGGGQATAPTSAFDTTTGFLFAAVGRQKITEFATATLTDNASNTLTLHDSAHNYGSLWPDSGVGIYTKANATGRSGCIVTDSKPSDADEITVMAVNVLNATTIEDFAFVYDTTGPTNTSGNVTVTKPSVLVAVWSGDDANGEQGPNFGAGWTRLQTTTITTGNHVQMAMAARAVSAGTYNVVITPQTSQGALTFLYGLN